MYRKIIVGYDGRERSEDAVALGSALAEATGAELMIASIYPHDPFPRTYVIEYEGHLRRDTEEMLDKLRARLGIGCETRAVGATSPARGLHDLAEDETDLIVVGSDADGPVGRILAGSTGQRLLHGAPSAVAVAPVGLASAGDGGGFRSLGVAFDGSPEAVVALRAAEELATALGAGLRLLAVVSPPSFGMAATAAHEGGYGGASASFSYSDLEDSARELLRGRLDRALEALPSELDAEASLLSGDPADEIAKEAGHGIDLLVTGSRGYGPLRRVLLGGVSTKLIRSAPCPILVVPRGAHVEAPAETAVGSAPG